MALYERGDGGERRFWDIEVDGESLTIRSGGSGTAGQSHTKVFVSAEAASAAHDALVAVKLAEGYALVGDEAMPADEAEPLRQAIDEDPDDPHAWLAYGDWLQREQDPRGDLVVAAASGADPTALLRRLEDELLGRFAGTLKPYGVFTWHMGHWKQAKVTCDYETAESMPDDVDGSADVLRHLLGHPSARFVQDLRLGLVDTFMDGLADWQGCLDVLVRAGVRPTLRRLFVGDYERVDDTEISWTTIGSLAGVWSVLPRLEHLTVQGCGIELGAIDAPRLRRLEVWSGGLGTEPVEQIGRAELPQLDHLEIWFGDDNYGGECSVDTCAGVLEGHGLRLLRSLGLMNAQFTDDLLEPLARSGILPQLERLDLSMGTMTDAGAEHLLRLQDRFAHLAHLDVSDNHLSRDMVGRLRKAFPRVTSNDQKDADDEWRYVSVSE
jgi:uncharacterized protein (TIGR02996 family)